MTRRLGTTRRWVAIVVGTLCLIGGYIGLAALGQQLGEFGAYSVWYLPAGVSLVVSMLWGWRLWPALALAELVTGVVVFHVHQKGFTWPVMIINALGYTGIYVSTGSLLRRLGIVSRADRLRPVLMIVALSGGVAPFLAALFGVGMQEWGHVAGSGGYWSDVRVWWIGDALGIATIAPPAMLLALVAGLEGQRFVPPSLRRYNPLLTAAQLLMPAVLAVVLFEFWSSSTAVLSLLTSPLVFVALRFGVAGTSLSTLALAPTMTVMADRTVGSTLLPRSQLQILLLGIAAIAFVVAAVVDERERSGQHHRDLAQIVESTSDLVAVVRRDGYLEYVNPAGRQMARLDPHEGLDGRHESDLYAATETEEAATEARLAAMENEIWSGSVTLRGHGDEEVAAQKVVLAHYAVDGRPLRTSSIVRDVTEQQALRTQLAQQVFVDDLTGLPNRAALRRELAHVHRRLDYARAQGAVLVVETGRLAELSAAMGDARTNEIICTVGQRVVLAAGPSTLVARLDAARFGILPFEPMSEEAALDLGRHVAMAVATSPLGRNDGVTLSAHVGIAVFPGSEVEEGELLLSAEVAARHAAVSGAVVLPHDELLNETARRTLELESRLRLAIGQRTWLLHYQPIVRADTLEITAAEGLLRFEDDPAASPYSFVLLAEKLGLIGQLGREILIAACNEANRWPGSIGINVNVSRLQLDNANFVPDLEEILATTGLSPERLTLEITESAAMANPEQVSRILHHVRQAGVRVALDDFGTGYSSLATLDALPIDILKLDSTFVRGLASSKRKRNLVAATIALSTTLGVSVIAEGIEDTDELAILVELGCHEAQGYAVARPAPPDLLWSLPAP